MRRIRRRLRRIADGSTFLRRWLRGWRGLLVMLALAASLTTFGLHVQARSGGLSDPLYLLVVEGAAAFYLILILRVVSALVGWLGRQAAMMQDYFERAISGPAPGGPRGRR